MSASTMFAEMRQAGKENFTRVALGDDGTFGLRFSDERGKQFMSVFKPVRGEDRFQVTIPLERAEPR